MEYNPRVEIIPAKPKPRNKRVAIYARVSSNSAEQLNSLTNQISGLTRLAAANPTWLLVDIYIDIAPSKTGSNRKDFNRLISDCAAGKVDIVLTKNISRFGRDTVEVLTAVEKLVDVGVRVVFMAEGIDTEKDDYRLYISVHESCAQAENESRSDNIRMGLSFRAAEGTAGLYKRRLYGYDKTAEGRVGFK